MTENLHEKWEEIDRKNIERYNQKLHTKKISSVVILVIILSINSLLSLSAFLANLIPLGFGAIAFGLFISTLYFLQTVKPAFKEPDRVYDPESNPI